MSSAWDNGKPSVERKSDGRVESNSSPSIPGKISLLQRPQEPPISPWAPVTRPEQEIIREDTQGSTFVPKMRILRRPEGRPQAATPQAPSDAERRDKEEELAKRLAGREEAYAQARKRIFAGDDAGSSHSPAPMFTPPPPRASTTVYVRSSKSKTQTSLQNPLTDPSENAQE